MPFEVIVNPFAGIAKALIILVAVTGITFLSVLILCGFRTEDLLEAENA